MKKPVKIGCIALLSMAFLFILAGLGIFIFADVVVEIAGKIIAKKMVSEITGTEFSIGNVKVSIFKGRIKLTDVVLKNPEGYSGSALNAGTVYVEVDMNSILTDRIVVKQVLIENIRVNYERRLESSNIDVIQKNIETRSASRPKSETATEAKSGKKGKTWVIRTFDVKKGVVSVTVISKNVSATVPLSDIHIENLGDSAEGKPLYELLPEIFTLLLSDILNAVSSAGFGSGIIDNIQKAPSSVIKTIKNLF
ncbi:MAG: hypothetical protein A2017_17975 [Lentisphaerae bacterium GWF2_44_16]|nr:MAG: hypothetical protein A2017_17975 [Lentisphaerae bacterium GWF2_44_16]